MTLQLNPTVNDPFATKTLQQLRVMVQDALGFVQPQLPETNAAGFRTLGDLATQVRIALGIAAPVPVVPDTLGNIRTNLYNMLGMGAMTIHPPGVDTQLTTFINTAQQIIYRALEVDAGGIAQDLGPENVTNGSFNGSAASWTLGAEWAYSTASITNTNAGTHTVAQQLIPVVAGNTYFIQWTQSQSVPYNVGTNANGQGIIATLGGVQAAPILLQTTSATSVAVAITATVTGGVLLTFQNATGSPQLPGWTPSGTVAITGVSCKQMGVGTVLGTQPPPMLITGINDAALTKLDATAILNLACALAKTHYGQPDGKTYFEWYQKWLKDLEGRGPPNISSIINNALQDAQREVSRTYEVAYAAGGIPANAAFSAATDTVGMDAWAVYKLAVAKVKAMLKSNDAELALKEYTKYISDLNERMPANANSVINRLLKQAQDFLFRTYDVFRMERWFTWTLVAGQRFYGVNADDGATITTIGGLTATLGTAVTFGQMLAARTAQSAYTLPDGRVLFFGGADNSGSSFIPTEFFSPSTNQNTVGPNEVIVPSFAASFATVALINPATGLPSGNVFACGGQSPPQSVAEIYNYALGTIDLQSLTMYAARAYPQAVALPDGSVLIAGGLDNAGNRLQTVEQFIYDPAFSIPSVQGYFSPVSGFNVITCTAGAGLMVALANGDVIAVSDTNGSSNGKTELYSAALGLWAQVGNAVDALRNTATGLLLKNGNVMVTGGLTSGFAKTNTTEIYNPISKTWAAGPSMVKKRIGHQMTLLPNGTVLVSGGVDETGTVVATAEIYNPATNSFSLVGSMSAARQSHTATLLQSGFVLIAGGTQNPSSTIGAPALSSMELYNTTTQTFSTIGGQTAGNLAYRIAALSATGTTLASLPEATINAVPANTSVVLNWTAPNNPTVTAINIFGRTKGTPTTSTASFVISLTNTITLNVTTSTNIVVGANAIINDGSNLVEVVVSGKTSGSITFKVIQIGAGAVGNVMANAASVYSELEQLLTTVPVSVTTWTDNGTLIPSGALPKAYTIVSSFGLDPREISWVGASCNQNTWRELKEGVPAQIYNAQVTGPPAYYEIRQAIEIWPTPPDSTWQLQIKGYFSPLPFDTDSDTCWIDYQAVYLYATAKAMLQWPKRFDARAKADADAAWMRYVKELVAGTHKTARYVPGTPRYRPVRPLPVMVP